MSLQSKSDRKLKIAYDSSGITCSSSGDRGIGRYATQHLAALLEEDQNVQIVLVYEENRDLRKLDRYRNIPQVSFCEIKDLWSLEYDVLHLADPMSLIPSVTYLLNHKKNKPITVLFYDLIPIILHQYYLDNYPPTIIRGYLERLATIESRVNHIFTISDSTRNDLIRVTGVAEEKCTVIYAGTAINSVLPSHGFKNQFGKYFLAVGGLDNHKGFATTLNAFLSTIDPADASLVVAGSTNDANKSMYAEKLKDMGVRNVTFLGFVSEEDLAGLYQEATALVFPSLYEGFGFPVLEAMAKGCPVITRKNSSLPEVLGDAGLYAEDETLGSMLLEILKNENLQNKLRVLGKERAKKFTWSNVAKSSLDQWNKIVAIER
jgi:glycosyltransferase involved in cell wall biosynthesis